MKRLRLFISVFLVVCFLGTVGCNAVVVSPKIEDTPVSTVREETESLNPTLYSTVTSTLVPTSTPTLEPTHTPTETPTETPVPTPTEVPPLEWDLDPYIEKVIEYEWEGVLIKARILIDKSMESTIKSIDIKDDVFAEVIARSIFVVWYTRNNPDVGWLWKDVKYFREIELDPESIYPFMEMWAKAQKSGNTSDWEKVQINDIWANNLNDGNGYAQKPYDMWPMYYGEASSGVIGMDMLTLVLAKTSYIQNVFRVNRSDEPEFRKLLDTSFGTNLNNGDLMIYRGMSWDPKLCDAWPTGSDCFKEYYYEGIGLIPTWLSLNSGEPIWYPVVKYSWIYYFIKSRGVDVEFVTD